MNSEKLIQTSTKWLSEDVFPLWIEKGIDPQNGSFVESLTFDGEPQMLPRRAMVQSRQIYSYTEALKLNLIDKSVAFPIIKKSTEFLMTKYSLDTGAFIHAVNPDGSPHARQSELYSQAFALFGLAKAFGVLHRDDIKARAKILLGYLKKERRAPNGGYTEIKNSEILFQSNPHMHLFEAALSWLTVDPDDSDWQALSKETYELCSDKLFVKEAGVIAEYYDKNWQPILEKNRFVFEPGHQYEWAWLILQYGNLSGQDLGRIPIQIFHAAEKYGVKESGLVIDEVWSDFSIKKATSRFWPQSERVKAALDIGNSKSADQAMETLWLFLKTPLKGVWYDTLLENGQFSDQTPKASSLYHIINAMSEYCRKRPLLK